MKDKKNLIQTIILSLVAIVVLFVAGVMVSGHFASKSDGQIQIQLVDLNGVTTLEKDVDFKEGDTLQYLLEENFDNVVIENGMLMSIEEFVTPADWSTYIAIYVNGEMSMVGLLEIEFEDGTLISFVMTEFNYDF